MRRIMGALPRADHLGIPSSFASNSHGAVVEEIPGLIRVYKDGHVDRPPVIPDVPCTWSPEPDVASKDVGFGPSSGVWARLYVPKLQGQQRLPLVVYFHGGGFCVGSAAWRCYHEFLARLASEARCSILSANYRLAPEHRLPAAYEDGSAVMRWVGQQASNCGRAADELSWWRNQCDFTRVFLSGDSAGAAIAYQTAVQLGSWPESIKPAYLKGVILIQPFFGGQDRTSSEKNLVQSPRSALRLETSDCYWRLALPPGCTRDHPWCNPLGKGTPKLESLRLPPVIVCSAEMDILKDRNTEFCRALKRSGKTVEQAIYAGVGHAFQVLHNYHMSHNRTQEMITHIKSFVNNNR